MTPQKIFTPQKHRQNTKNYHPRARGWVPEDSGKGYGIKLYTIRKPLWGKCGYQSSKPNNSTTSWGRTKHKYQPCIMAQLTQSGSCKNKINYCVYHINCSHIRNYFITKKGGHKYERIPKTNGGSTYEFWKGKYGKRFDLKTYCKHKPFINVPQKKRHTLDINK